jgi:hypothetical protein
MKIANRGNQMRRISTPICNRTLSSEKPKYRPLIERDRNKVPWRKRRSFIVAVVIVIFLIAASATYSAVNTLKQNNQVRTTSSPNLCYSLLYPKRDLAQLPVSWSFPSCLVAYGDPAAGRSPEISYTITGPGQLFTVSGTVSAKYTIEVVTENYFGTYSRSYTNPINSNDSQWSMNVPCDGYNGCKIDIFNNASSNNPLIVNFTAS